ncbi:MAG: NAD kinase [Sinomicrobium sp.]|nr:NAD kinase [Sinomicrobium sp.]
MKIALYGQSYRENFSACVIELLHALEHYDMEVIIEENYLRTIRAEAPQVKRYPTFQAYEDLDHTYDLFFSIGGDGTILRTVTYVRDLGIPVIGINTGRLGFLATVQQDEVAQAVNAIVNKAYTIVPRSLLQATVTPRTAELEEINVALNEIAVSRKNTTSMITIPTYLNNEYLTSYWADGLIISTPTGSTGYSLSCGGPVMAPDTNSLVLTPIAPHNLNARPLVVSDDTVIRLKVSGREDEYLVSLDSRVITISNEAEVTVRRAPFSINMVSLDSESFLKTLRKKLLWGEDRRN